MHINKEAVIEDSSASEFDNMLIKSTIVYVIKRNRKVEVRVLERHNYIIRVLSPVSFIINQEYGVLSAIELADTLSRASEVTVT